MRTIKFISLNLRVKQTVYQNIHHRQENSLQIMCLQTLDNKMLCRFNILGFYSLIFLFRKSISFRILLTDMK
jgi:hypothetical protein